MRLIFIYGPPAVGKLTVARALAQITGDALFHNHLVVDAVGAVFPFGSEPFVRLREALWLQIVEEAVKAGRSMIFTYAPEASVAADFPARLAALVQAGGGKAIFVRLSAPFEVLEQRVDAASREAFGKLRSVELMRSLRDELAACDAAMPLARIDIDTAAVGPAEAARRIAEAL